jgi:hypothetical protein
LNDPYIAEDQGAEFAYNALKHLLEMEHPPKSRGPVCVPVSSSPITISETQNAATQLIEKYFGTGDFHILLHIDEHRHMCQWNFDKHKYGYLFSYGAMNLWQFPSKVKVVATYTDVPYEINPVGSSAVVSRYPLFLPDINLARICRKYPDLVFPGSETKDKWSFNDQFLLDNLQFRLWFRFSASRANLHNGDELEQFTRGFHKRATGGKSLTERLEDCLQFCTLNGLRFSSTEVFHQQHAVFLLLGIQDKLLGVQTEKGPRSSFLQDIDARIADLVVLPYPGNCKLFCIFQLTHYQQTPQSAQTSCH